MASEMSTLDGITRKRRVGVWKHEIEEKLLQPKATKSKAKKKVSFETKPLVYDDDDRNQKKGEVCKMKILMTKEEAARLLSKCKDGGRLEFKDVVPELLRIPIHRVNLIDDHKQL